MAIHIIAQAIVLQSVCFSFYLERSKLLQFEFDIVIIFNMEVNLFIFYFLYFALGNIA